MIDRTARDELAELLHQFVAGRITNYDFENSVPASDDPAIYEIAWAAWFLYDDLHEHTLTAGYRVPGEYRRDIARWIIFLHSDEEYRWPRETGFSALPFLLLSLVTLGIAGYIRRKWNRSKHDETIWPFASDTDLKSAVSAPRYFGSRA
jgi:hypothetical protein